MSKDSWLLAASVYLLVGLGLVMTYSASAVYAEHLVENQQYFVWRQIAYALVGSLVLLITTAVPTRFWKRYARLLVLIAIVALLTVFIPVLGHAAGGARRWIRLGPVHFQPAEFAKIAICLYLADYLSRKRGLIKDSNLRVFFPPMALIGIMSGLLLLQPDLGSCAFLVMLGAILFFWSGIRWRYVFGAALLFLPLFYFLIMRVPYRVSRVTAYLNPWEDPQGSGFQIIQSMIAFGHGGLTGVGLGEGIQKLFYLPSSHNDFIFSIVGEELGFAGALFVLILYALIFIAGLRIASKADQDYLKMASVALTLSIVLQALINMMVTTGLMPTKGLPLPFVSFGGTAIVFNLMAVGLLLGMDRELELKHKTAPFTHV